MVIPCFMQDLTSKCGVAPVSCVQKPCEMRLVSCPLPQGIRCRLPDFVVGKLALESACGVFLFLARLNVLNVHGVSLFLAGLHKMFLNSAWPWCPACENHMK